MQLVLGQNCYGCACADDVGSLCFVKDVLNCRRCLVVLLYRSCYRGQILILYL